MTESTLKQVRAILEKSVNLHFESEAAGACVDAICREMAMRGDQSLQRVKLSGLPTWTRLKASPVTDQIDVALYCALVDQPHPGWGRDNQQAYWHYQSKRDVIRTMGIQLLKADLPFSDMQIAAIIFKSAKDVDPDSGIPAATLLAAVERHCGGKHPEEFVGLALRYQKMWIERLESQLWPTKRTQKIKDRIDAILAADFDQTGPALPAGAWMDSLEPWLGELNDKRHAGWIKLLSLAATAGDKSKPTKKWLEDARPLVSAVGRPAVSAQLKSWLASTVPDPRQADTSLDVLKGMIWSAELLKQEDNAPAIGRFAEVCFRKIPQIGARSVKLGNACISTLSAMKTSDAAIGELVRLKTRIKYGSVRSLIDRRLEDLVRTAGVGVADLEESALSDFGFGPDATQRVEFGDVTATITLADNRAVPSWFGGDGKARKSPPASVKRDYADALKAIKQKLKDIDVAMGVQTARLETSWVEGRSWPLEVWRSRFLEHNLRRPLTQALIWRFESDNRLLDLMPSGEDLADIAGNIVQPDPGATVRLWHPLDSQPDTVLAWRRRILDEGLRQPIKQAHREIYVLTDAERETRVYSNRFAAHILMQHQFAALCQQRGWQYQLQGYWDSFNLPTRHIPGRDLSVAFHVEIAEEDETSPAYIPMHVATDQVRFLDGDGQLDLDQVPPIVFSELMRDVDLFVAVTSVANDPDWSDGGPEGRYGAYWREHAFGDLGQTAQVRRDLVAEIIPKLAISDRLAISGNFLEVQGKHHRYRIHLGSSNIQILPSNQYLCIVRGAMPNRTGKLKLPFSGDSLLSIILSKALMLVDEDKITDRTILSQLGLGTSDPV